MSDVLMPRLSDSMEEGTVVRWLKADGDEVARGEELVEIETDKATMAYEADAAGPVSIVADEGATLPVGALIATIGAAATRTSAADAAAPAPPPPAGAASPTAPAPASPAGSRVSASPVARRAAARLGVALEAVAGSGAHGRVLKRDIVAAAANGGMAPAVAPSSAQAAAPSAPPAPDSGGARGGTERVALSRIQQVVARRMAEAKATVPDFALEVDVDMRAALALREELRTLIEPAPSVNDLLVKAVGRTLRRHPRLNGSYRGDHVELHERVNVGIAVATDAGLLVPTLRDADAQPLGALAAQARRLVERARDGALTPPEMAGGTFTVSNLGMLGVDRFAGIVNPPQAAILCAGAIARRPMAGPDDAVIVAPCLTLTLVCDHRILDGADGARFLADLRGALERPLALLT